ncbi:hypothetical protein AVEN_156262-1 [Araneus ventricosus]|uniref:RNase H type-1 domain-containing protein n=1 Tax=Araneus ventricosus TaxID=182803 RepID=A0A4Y2EPS4_ARAVE|nr:hypothetical protein AVEN_156262-1 [Araneus ventricosus]
MVSKTARTRYSISGGTTGPETRNRPCNQPPSPANHHLSGHSGECPGGIYPRRRNTTSREICKSLITDKHIHISWIKVHVGYDGSKEADSLVKEATVFDRDPLSVKAPISFLKSIFKKKMSEE